MWPIFALLKDHADLVIAVSAAGGVGWRFVGIPVRKRWKERSERIERSRLMIDQIAADTTLVKKELFPNSGGSLRDTLDRVVVDLGQMRRTHIVTSDFVRALACEAGVMIQQFDAKGDLLWATEKWHTLTGLTLDQAAGWGWVNALFIEDRDRVEDRWNDALKHRRPFIDSFRFQHVQNGTISAVRVEAYPSELTLEHEAAPAGWIAQLRLVVSQ